MHQEPELSNVEWKTQSRIRGILQRFGIDGAKVFHNTGLYVDVVGTASGQKQSIAVRGDIDACPFRRREMIDRKSTGSCMPAVMTCMAQSRSVLRSPFNNFAGRVRVFFQPAEEAESLGGRTVEAEKLLDGFDRAVGFHITAVRDVRRTRRCGN
nr:hypothetical protein [Bradyrhizobium sp. 168]